MDRDLLTALQLILGLRENGELHDRTAPEGGYCSQELEDALDLIARHVARAPES